MILQVGTHRAGWSRPVMVALGLSLALVISACSVSAPNTTAANGGGGGTTVPAPLGGADSSGSTPPSGSPGTRQPTARQAGDVPQQFKGFTSDLFSKPESWMCKPGLATDYCLTSDLDSTIVKADGSAQAVPRQVVKDAPVDCFYVYPTVNLKPGGGNKEDLTEIGIEVAVLKTQGARFTEVCNVYAPLYHQMNLSAYSSPEPERKKAEEIAYSDVLAAFKHYMANENKGRPFVLIGHSQGSGHLARLLKEQFDGNADMQSRLVSALLIGGFVQVPAGKDVGGTFNNIPLCRSNAQNGCVVAYNSFGTGSAPTGVGFGTTQDGLVGACVNPAAPGGGSGVLKSFIPGYAKANGLPAVTTPFAQLPDTMNAECKSDANRTYLAISATPKSGDQRDVTALVANQPGWGLHITEFNLTVGNLVDLVQSQTAGLK